MSGNYENDDISSSGEHKSEEYNRQIRNEEEIENLRAEIADLRADNANSILQINELQNTIQRINTRRDELINQQRALNTQIDEINADYRDASNRRDQLSSTLLANNDRIRQLENLIEGGEDNNSFSSDPQDELDPSDYDSTQSLDRESIFSQYTDITPPLSVNSSDTLIGGKSLSLKNRKKKYMKKKKSKKNKPKKK